MAAVPTIVTIPLGATTARAMKVTSYRRGTNVSVRKGFPQRKAVVDNNGYIGGRRAFSSANVTVSNFLLFGIFRRE